MDELRSRLITGDLVHDVRRLLQGAAEDHAQWLRDNIRQTMTSRRQDAVAISALTGLAPGTVRGFLNGRPSSIRNVLLIVEAIGCSLGELDHPPEEFRRRESRSDAEGAALGASLLAFDESSTAMAVVLLDGTIVKVNRQLCALLGYEEGELIGSPAATFSATTDAGRAERVEELTVTDAMHGRATQLRRKDGSLVSAVTSALVVRGEDGEPRYVIARAVLESERRSPTGSPRSPAIKPA